MLFFINWDFEKAQNMFELCNTITWTDDKHHQMAVVGFEPTPPERLEPKSSALDHSATLPDVAL